jgi:biotin operon repressor
MDPPMLLVCLNRQLATADAITETGVFAVNILAEDQGELAAQFATRHPDKFRGVQVVEEELGVPILAGALAHLECRVAERTDVATHAVFMAEVQNAQSKPGNPLAYFRSRFGRFNKAADDHVCRLLREHVLARTADVGEVLTLDRMAAELGIDRAQVYYALQELRSEGLVLPDRDSGYRIAPPTADAV